MNEAPANLPPPYGLPAIPYTARVAPYHGAPSPSLALCCARCLHPPSPGTARHLLAFPLNPLAFPPCLAPKLTHRPEQNLHQVKCNALPDAGFAPVPRSPPNTPSQSTMTRP